MKGSITTLGIVYIGLFLLMVIISYHTEAYRHNSIISTMTESGQIASINSIDKSSRVEDGRVEVTEESFKRNSELSLNKTAILNYQELSTTLIF